MVMVIHYDACKAKNSPHATKVNDGGTHTPVSALCSWVLIQRFPDSAVLSQECWFQSESIVAAPFLSGRQKQKSLSNSHLEMKMNQLSTVEGRGTTID